MSFSGETRVKLANGETKPISKIKPGDKVLATDPQAGERASKTVTHVWVHSDTLLDLKVDGKTVTTTEDHPFWNATDRQWQRADRLDPGDRLLTANGRLVAVEGLNWPTAHTATAYNLTVTDIHTYYVLAGDVPVLVHNCGGARFEVDSNGVATDLDANPLAGTRYTEKVREQIDSGDDHGFPALIDDMPTMRDTSVVTGGDGVARTHVTLPGAVNGKKGTFHWIIESDGSINHRFFDRRMK